MFIYDELLFKPILNLLIFLYNILPVQDIGLAIIILTILVKLLLLPLSKKSLQSQKALQEIQPKIEELKAKHKDNKEALAMEMMQVYKEYNVNPFSSCLPLLIQIPFFIAVYHVFRVGLGSQNFEGLYSFVSNPGTINTMFLGVIDLAKPAVILALLAGGAQYIQAKMLSGKQPPKKLQQKDGAQDENALAAMNKQMMYMMPIITVVIGISLPGGLTLYWFLTTALTILQQKFYFGDKKEDKKTLSDDNDSDTDSDTDDKEKKVVEGEIVS